MQILGFKIGIFYKDPEWLESKHEEIIKSISAIMIHHYTKTKIFLQDGTSIEFVPAVSRCGNAFDRVFYQEGIDDDVIHQMITPTLKLFGPMIMY